MKVTNMSCLTPEGALSGDCDFLSANMYARSLFGMHSLSAVVKLLSQRYRRRGRVGKPEYRENRSWKHHRSCADTKQNTGHCFVFGRPYHDISKGRQASCLMEWVDTRVLYDRFKECILHPLEWNGRLCILRPLSPRQRSREALQAERCAVAGEFEMTNVCS